MSSTPSSSSSSLPSSTLYDTNHKRRKVRKGTFSCWECKHRKRRCIFEPASNPSCVYCDSRGLQCISQAFADPSSSSSSSSNNYEQVEDRIQHIESLVDHLLRQRKNAPPTKSQRQAAARISGDKPPLLSQPGLDAEAASFAVINPVGNRHTPTRSLGSFLLSYIPPPSTAFMILTKGRFFYFPFTLVQSPRVSRPPATIETAKPDAALELSSSTTPPVDLARKLVQLALGLQQLSLTSSHEVQLQLRESPGAAAQRYLTVASRHVTSDNELVCSLEGLDTLMLEARYHINVGTMRPAWLIFRRALSVAQMLGYPQQLQQANQKMQALFFRLVYCDRFLSLILGLPLSLSDNSFADEHFMAKLSPFDRLERMHVVLAGRIADRNMRMLPRFASIGQREEAGFDDYKETDDIDYELRKAIRNLPIAWWDPPVLENQVTEEEKMGAIAQIITQMHHHYLLILLYQPYLFQHLGRSREADSVISVLSAGDHGYKKLAILSASREVLTRCLAFRDEHPMMSYHGLDNKAFVAATALLIIHVDGHNLGRANALEHQRPLDLRTVDNVIDILEQLCTRNHLTSPTIGIVRKLRVIEEEAADGAEFYVLRANEVPEAAECSLKLEIPYFGSFCILRRSARSAAEVPMMAVADPTSMFFVNNMGFIGGMNDNALFSTASQTQDHQTYSELDFFNAWIGTRDSTCVLPESYTGQQSASHLN
ncbi:uncharacterized protein BO95DRAFT_443972 [Aspergillus brunneoviolaceus CBS 621.78]|uniref:Uncharacterized protein n=1 Tax=Aspergillus brunneoviolaceus CBS 621.78 TaxID=1450534 RepID=A0ACD1G5K8_9EURO|nr:hypothetical protein BO95DRAFT_443972 [Aspergillus brunneoviolaceus CBS 621.78]RAH44526.1 hypothetical protein BO95DRAFT_443972 [Aspergillus brunneoviolaceus CBS 621.78]